MGLSFQDVETIKLDFRKKYLLKEPYSTYVNKCGISTVGMMDADASTDQVEDFCISVGLRKPLPSDLTLPEEYQGVRVFVEVVGEIRPQ